jgi:multidrug resistance protein, MATE family
VQYNAAMSTIETTAQTSPSNEPKGMRQRVLKLAGPVIGENLLQTMLGIVDTWLVAGLGTVALAGVGTALQVVYVIIAALSALSVGASVLVAQAVGGRDLPEAARLARQAVVWSLLLSLPIMLVGVPLAPAIIGLFGVEPAVATVGTDYLAVTVGSIASLTVMYLASGVLRGIGDSRTPMLVTALSNVINIAVSAVLIYGAFGFAGMGAVGSAWGTVVARVIGALLLIAVLWRGRNGVKAAGGNWWPQFRPLRNLLWIGFPAALEELLIIGAFATLTPVVAALGTASLAAHRVAINVLSLSFLPGLGFGLAVTALVGNAIGAQRMDEARAATAIGLRWAIIWMSGLGALFLLAAPLMVRLFSDDPTLIDEGANAIRVVALTQPLWAISFVMAGALRGTGDTRTPLVITGFWMWVAVGLAFLAVRFVQPHLWAVWAVFLITGPLEAWMFWRRWRRVG